jgi:hypothetical protein
MKFALAGLLAAVPLVASSAEPEVERSCEQVDYMLGAGFTPAEVVAAEVDAGMALTGATVFAMECAPGQYRQALAAAGVGLANSIIEARSVVDAVSYAYGDNAPETDAAREANRKYERLAKQPDVYKGNIKPTGGGGVSPS